MELEGDTTWNESTVLRRGETNLEAGVQHLLDPVGTHAQSEST